MFLETATKVPRFPWQWLSKITISLLRKTTTMLYDVWINTVAVVLELHGAWLVWQSTKHHHGTIVVWDPLTWPGGTMAPFRILIVYICIANGSPCAVPSSDMTVTHSLPSFLNHCDLGASSIVH